jgi:hypothetical protein
MPGPADRLSVLRANPFFGALSEEDLSALAPLLRALTGGKEKRVASRSGSVAHEPPRYVLEPPLAGPKMSMG